MKITAIYKIQSKIKPDRIYIGSAVDVSDRWRCHLKTLRKRTHHSPKIQRHFDKYGESDLQFSILLSCDKENLLKVEQYFIDSYNPYFNSCKIAGSQLGMSRSSESKKRISDGHKGQISWNKGKKGLQVAWNKGLIGYRAGRKDSNETCEKHRQANLKNGNKPPSRKGIKMTSEQKEKAKTIREKNKLSKVS